MRSLQLKAIGQLHLLELPLPRPQPGEVLLKVSHCALCRTDAKMLLMGQRDLNLPRVPGHEICAFDEQTGERFVVWPGEACGFCRQCCEGRENLCPRMQIVGFHKDGGLAEYISVPKASLLPIAETLPDPLACLAEPLACALNALELSKLRAAQNILIYGGGPAGLLMAMAARSLGATPFVVETNAFKLEKSREYRTALEIDAAQTCTFSEFDAVINAAPSPEILLEGIYKLKAGGCFCLFSGFTGEHTYTVALINEIHYRQLHLTGAYGCTRRQMKQALEVLSAFPTAASCLIEGVIGLEDVAEALQSILAGNAFKFVAKL